MNLMILICILCKCGKKKWKKEDRTGWFEDDAVDAVILLADLHDQIADRIADWFQRE